MRRSQVSIDLLAPKSILDGLVTQLRECYTCNVEVAGLNPVRSTNLLESFVLVRMT